MARLIDKISKNYMDKSSQTEINDILYKEKSTIENKVKEQTFEKLKKLFKSKDDAFRFFDMGQNGNIKTHHFVFCIDFMHKEDFMVADILELF